MMKKILLVITFWLGGLALGVPSTGLTDLEGNTPNLDTESKKRLVVFWATWCPDCKKHLKSELPEINKRPNVSVVTINTDRNAKRAKKYVQKSGLTLPVLRDEGKNLRKALKVFSVPHWAVYKKSDKEWALIDTAPAFEMNRIEKALSNTQLN